MNDVEKVISIYEEKISSVEKGFNIVACVYCNNDCIFRECFYCDSYRIQFITGRKRLILMCGSTCISILDCTSWIINDVK